MHRIIARLDIKGPNLVKGIHLEGLRVLGKPEDFARYYYESGADELMYMDVVASLYERNSLKDIISRTAREIFIPLTVGGGIRSITDIREVLRAGADKVSLNTAIIRNPGLITEASGIFGSSTIVVAIEAIKSPDGNYYAYVDNGRDATGVEVVSWAKRVEKLGAGEIVITSVDKEGTGEGYDLELTKKVSSAVSVPVIAHGGAGKVSHVREVIEAGGADAVAVASMFHYETIRHISQSFTGAKEGNIEFLKKGKPFTPIHPASIDAVKKELFSHHIPCRYCGNEAVE
ncbi:MAG: imidazole glycerol phosphate synthase subunit HisF [Oscillospiraceae bacterium]